MRLALALLLIALPATAEGLLPVKVHPRIKAFRGGPSVIVAQDGATVYSLVSGHKEARRPWADVILRKTGPDGQSFVARAFDCAAGTVRRLGEGRTVRDIPLSITDLAQLRDRPVVPGSVDHAIGRYVCAL